MESKDANALVRTTTAFDALFEKFIAADKARTICHAFNAITNSLKINTQQVFDNNPNGNRMIYKIIQSKTTYWKSNKLWEFYDKIAAYKEYERRSGNKDLKVLIIGAGPVGLRLSIECALLGLQCSIIEKRDTFSRNNVLHLWKFTIEDLKRLGAKSFYGKFCAGSIDHISIRTLQCVLLKAALLFGVQVNFNLNFLDISEPIAAEVGWHVKTLPENHPVTRKSFDVIIGADGRQNTIPGFKKSELRAKLAIGITCNFVNSKTPEESIIKEQSGVTFIYKQQFFKDIKDECNIDLENIVYYKDDTHYFVMTAKRQSLIEKGVILNDCSDPVELLSARNVDKEQLYAYAREAAFHCTEKQMCGLQFAKNHYSEPDVAMFDFTTLFRAENASRIVERHGQKLLLSLVGDSLLEPFWPTGTGIAHGFLAVMDTAWQIKRFAENPNAPLQVISERETIYRLLNQTTQHNMNQNLHDYTIDPTTRYSNYFHMQRYDENPFKHLFDNAITAQTPLRSIENINTRLPSFPVPSQTLLKWCQIILQPYGLRTEDFTNAWRDGLAFSAIIHRFRPDLIDFLKLTEERDLNKTIARLMEVLVNELGLDIGQTELLNVCISRETVLMILRSLYNRFKDNAIKEVDIAMDTSLPVVQKNKRKQPSLEDSNKRVTGIKNKFESTTDTIMINTGPPPMVPIVDTIFSDFQRQKSDSVTINRMSESSNANYSNKFFAPSICYECKLAVGIRDRQNVMQMVIHTDCFRCHTCKRRLDSASYDHAQDSSKKYIFYCTQHKPLIFDFRKVPSPIQKPDVRVDDTYNVNEFKNRLAFWQGQGPIKEAILTPAVSTDTIPEEIITNEDPITEAIVPSDISVVSEDSIILKDDSAKEIALDPLNISTDSTTPLDVIDPIKVDSDKEELLVNISTDSNPVDEIEAKDKEEFKFIDISADSIALDAITNLKEDTLVDISLDSNPVEVEYSKKKYPSWSDKKIYLISENVPEVSKRKRLHDWLRNITAATLQNIFGCCSSNKLF